MAKAKPITGLDPHARTSKNARIIARIRLEEMYEWDRYVDDPSNVSELHNLRIAAKRVRYTLEVFEDVLPEACKAIVNELTQVQDELGALHDSDVLIALLRLSLKSQDNANTFTAGLFEAANQHEKEQVQLQPELVADILDVTTLPSSEERYGLKQLLLQQEQLREKQYTAFRQHWYQLQERNFRGEVLDILNT